MVLNGVTVPVDSTKQMLLTSGKGCNLFRDLFDSKGFWKSTLIKNLYYHITVKHRKFTVLSRLLNLHKSLHTLPKATVSKATYRVVILFPTLSIYLTTKVALTVPVTASCSDRQMFENHMISRKIIPLMRSICVSFWSGSLQK